MGVKSGIGRTAALLMQDYMQKKARQEVAALQATRDNDLAMKHLETMVLNDPTGQIGAKLIKSGLGKVGSTDLNAITPNPDSTLMSPLREQVSKAETPGDLASIDPESFGAQFGIADDEVGEGAEPWRVTQADPAIEDIRSLMAKRGVAIESDTARALDLDKQTAFNAAEQRGLGEESATSQSFPAQQERETQDFQRNLGLEGSPESMDLFGKRANLQAGAGARAAAQYRAPEIFTDSFGRTRALKFGPGGVSEVEMPEDITQKGMPLPISAQAGQVLGDAMARATMTLPVNRRNQQIAIANQMIERGDDEGLKQVIKQAAIEGEPVSARENIRGREATVTALRDVRRMLTEMEAAGLDTNLLVGGAEGLARTLGKSQDPRYVQFSTRLYDTLVQYRRQATGVQFSVKEEQNYAQMFPNLGNDLPVNHAALDGLERSMNGTLRNYWINKVGPEAAELLSAPDEPAPLGQTGTGLTPRLESRLPR